MKYVMLVLWIGVSTSLSASTATPDTDNGTDSGVTGPPFHVILHEMESLAHRYPKLARVRTYGKTVQERPLKLLLVMKRGRHFRHRPTLVMSGSTHGNEYLHIEDRLPRELLAQSEKPGPVADFLKRGGAFVFIPVLNPDGYEAHVRENARGVDLNRDWSVPSAHFTAFRENESRFLARELDRLQAAPYHLNYRITVDYHCCIGALLPPWGYTTKPIPAEDAARHQPILALAKRLLDIDVGKTGEVLGYFPMGTTKDYYYDHYGALSFTYEGRYRTEKDYFPQHLLWWQEMAEYVTHPGPATAPAVASHRIKSSFAKLAD